jgi:hypothetical protein
MTDAERLAADHTKRAREIYLVLDRTYKRVTGLDSWSLTEQVARAFVADLTNALTAAERAGAEKMREQATELLMKRQHQWNDEYNLRHTCSLTVQNELARSANLVRALPLPGEE